MDFTKLSNKELKKIMRKHHDMVCSGATSITQENLDEAWGASYETIQRTQATIDEQSERISSLEEEMSELIVTDITYRGAYKFIYYKGMEKEFEKFLLQSIDEVASNIIPFPTSH